VIDYSANSYTYDAENRPIVVNGAQVLYDAFGRAVEMYKNGAYTQIVYGPSGDKFAYMSRQSVQHYNVPLAAGVEEEFNSTGLQYVRHTDWLGSSRAVLYNTGWPYRSRAHAPYGEAYAESGSEDRIFTGQTQDVTQDANGVYDFLFRQYSSSQSRWLVPDPSGLAAVDITNPQTWNRYAYVGNNPLSNTDPEGLDSDTDCEGQPCGWPGVPPFLPAGDGPGGPNGSFCGYICGSPPFPLPFPPPVGGGGGGGGGHPASGGGAPPSNPPGGNSGGGTVTWPNETNGIPNGLNVNFGGPLGAILPSAVCGDLGPCPSIGNSIVGVDDAAEIAGLIYLTGLTIYAVEKYGPPLIHLIKDATKSWTGEWSDIPGCNAQYESDRKICAQKNSFACWKSASERLATCNGSGGARLGWPPLRQ
jgi:RHS repeat-associated protein